jgi:hypothetical protein
MRKSLLAVAIASAFAVPTMASAQTAPAAAPASPHTIAGNMTIASDYRFRGISQTYRGPAIQGGIDYSHSSGFYIGNWNSNVASQVYTGGAGIEMDLYGGWKQSFGDFGLDLGYITYLYPNAEFTGTAGSKKFTNQELYVGGSWKWLSAKYFYSIGDYFGLSTPQAFGGYWTNRNTGAALDPVGNRGGSKGSTYFDLTATFPVNEKFAVIGHYGKLKAKHYGDLDYADWKFGATYDLAGWVLGASYITTNAKKEWYYTGGSKGNKDTGTGALIFSVAKTF